MYRMNETLTYLLNDWTRDELKRISSKVREQTGTSKREITHGHATSPAVPFLASSRLLRSLIFCILTASSTLYRQGIWLSRINCKYLTADWVASLTLFERPDIRYKCIILHTSYLVYNINTVNFTCIIGAYFFL
jgi:hypothetical protein